MTKEERIAKLKELIVPLEKSRLMEDWVLKVAYSIAIVENEVYQMSLADAKDYLFECNFEDYTIYDNAVLVEESCSHWMDCGKAYLYMIDGKVSKANFTAGRLIYDRDAVPKDLLPY